MARISLDDRIKKQEEAVFKAKDKYEAEMRELDKLLTKRREIESKELVKAFEKSKKSLKEIIEFMNGSLDDED
ncbi:MAG: ErpK protein [Butyrivibrio sp.]|nr:ErpK protein [Butyrivibrio sp.]MBR1643379.1 ErpK protein [Butyrivibrio sp.]